MRSVIVVTSEPINLNHMSEIYHDIGSVNLRSEDRLIVEGEWGLFIIEIDQALENDFSDPELSNIRMIIPKPLFSQLMYRTSDAADLAIRLMDNGGTTLIDNDFGLILRIEEVKQRIHSGLKWQVNST